MIGIIIHNMFNFCIKHTETLNLRIEFYRCVIISLIVQYLTNVII